MTTSSPKPTPDAPATEDPLAGVVRQTVDLMVVLCFGVLLFRTFSAEAYVVPTGSMAPTLLGHHRELVCPNCAFPFDVGVDDQGPPARAVCPNCGSQDFEAQPAVARNGDRVLVQKFLFDFRPPERWEAAVFLYPADPSQAYVKRVVGLPGESVRIVDGDVWVDGRIARKRMDDARAMRILVHDGRYVPADAARFPRWEFRRGTGPRFGPSGWTQDADGFHHRAASGLGGSMDDWLVYRHWDPVRSRYAGVRDS
jgi:signal peptidase I